MTNAERILATLHAAAGILCDDCVSRIANVTPRQQVNAITSQLFQAKRIVRQDRLLCSSCKRVKKGSTCLGGPLPAMPSARLPPTLPSSTLQGKEGVNPSEFRYGRPGTDINSARLWHWEGNVQVMLRRFLEAEGWTITRFANTESKEPGVDLEANKGSRTILFEVKGYPTTVHDYGEKRGQAKVTQPSSQARQWYSHALLKMMLLREQHDDKEIALCFPDWPTYRRLIAGTQSSLQILGVVVYLISQTGDVSILLG